MSYKEMYENLAESPMANQSAMLAPSRRLSETVRMCARTSSESVMDVGCGDGILLRLLSGRHTIRAFGVDLSETRLRRARQENVIQPTCADASRLPFDSGVFDLCICTEVLEHLETPEIAIGEFHRVLKPEGRLVLTIPVYGWYRLLEARLTGRVRFLNEAEHIREYAPVSLDRCVNIGDLEGQLNVVGFRVTARQGIYYLPRGERLWNRIFGHRSPLQGVGAWLDHRIGKVPTLASWGRYLLLECLKA